MTWMSKGRLAGDGKIINLVEIATLPQWFLSHIDMDGGDVLGSQFLEAVQKHCQNKILSVLSCDGVMNSRKSGPVKGGVIAAFDCHNEPSGRITLINSVFEKLQSVFSHHSAGLSKQKRLCVSLVGKEKRHSGLLNQ